MPSPLGIRDASVTFSYGPSKVTALDRINLTVGPGEFVVVIGSNGAGKSSLINSIAGSVSLTSGDISVGARSVTSMSEHRRARYFARVFQGPTTGICRELTVAENLMIGFSRGKRRSILRRAARRDRIEIARAKLESYGIGLETSMNRPAALLSGGQQQLLALVMASLASPNVLLLDEHTSALDPKMARLVMDSTMSLVREGQITSIMVTHNMRHAAEFGDRVVIMDAGCIVGEISGADHDDLDETKLIETFRSLTTSSVSDEMLN